MDRHDHDEAGAPRRPSVETRVRSLKIGSPSAWLGLLVGVPGVALVLLPRPPIEPARATALAPSTSRPEVPAKKYAAPMLRDAPVGHWSEYRVGPPEARFQQIVAVVEKGKDQIVLETMIRSTKKNAPRIFTRQVFGEDARIGDEAQSTCVQIESGDPMDMPTSARPSNEELNLGRLNSEDLAGTEDVEVSAGRFRADRYRLKLGGGRENTVWMSADVAPLGLLRMHAEEHSPELQGSAADMELVGQGTGARPTIVKAPRPYDRETYARETMAAWKWQP